MPATPPDLDGASIPELRDYLSHSDPNLRGDAACALGDRLRTRELASLDADVQDEIAALLDDKVPTVRLEAAIALAEAHDHRATPVLLGAMHARTYRLDAIRALGTLGDPKAIGPLTTIMSRWLMPWADRIQAAAALCALGDAGGTTYLESKLQSRRHAERAAAIHFLGESRHPRARQLLQGLLADTNEPMRDVAARALGLLGDPAACEALRAVRPDADAELAEDIDAALEAIAKRSGAAV